MTRRRLAFLTDCFEDEFQNALLRALIGALSNTDLDLVSVQGGILDNPRHRARHFVYDLINPDNVDAVLVSTHTLSHFATSSVVRRFVESYSPLPRISFGVDLDGVPSLVVDNEEGFFRVVDHLINGHSMERIGFVGGPDHNPEARARFRGYLRALQEHGIPEDSRLITTGDFKVDSGTRAVSELCDVRGIRLDELDAIACANDETAIGLMDEMERRGIRVPHDVAVVGFDGIESFRHRRIPLTTARQPIEDQMRFAVNQLAAAIDGKVLEPSVTTFPAELVMGRSCGCSTRSFKPTATRFAPGESMAELSSEAASSGDLEGRLSSVDTGSVASVEYGWFGRLADSFLDHGLSEDPEPFFLTVENLLFDVLDRGGSVAIIQDLLMELHRWAIRSQTPGSDEADRANAVYHHALLLVGDLAQTPLAMRYREQMERMLKLSAITGQLTAVPDPFNLELGLEDIAPLGIESSLVALFPEDDHGQRELEVVDVHDHRTSHIVKGLRYPTADLVPAGFLDNRAVIVQPLVHHQEQLGVAVFETGSEGVVYELLRQAISLAVQGARLAHKVAQLAIRDPLTGLFNRRYLDPHLAGEVNRAHRNHQALTVAVVDLDDFKRVNDQHGHDVGDLVLMQIVEALQSSLRRSDLLARFGGDEFVVVAPNASRADATIIAERVIRSVEHSVCIVDPPMTVSMGFATLSPNHDHASAAELLHRADQALLEAKAGGKSCAAHWDAGHALML